MKKSISIAVITALLLMLTACGSKSKGKKKVEEIENIGSDSGDQGGDKNDSVVPDDNQTVPPVKKLLTLCQEDGENGYSSATVILSGKEIKKVTETTTLRLWHLKTGERKACVVTGEAEVR